MKLFRSFKGKKTGDESVVKGSNGKKNNLKKNAPKSKKSKSKKDTLTIDTMDLSVRNDGMPRISIALTMAELQDEAIARGIERQFLPTNKAALLEFLVDGSIYLRKTKAWMDVERLKDEMANDCRRIEEENHSRLEAQSVEGMLSRQPFGEDRSSPVHAYHGTRASTTSTSTSIYDSKTQCNTASLSRSDSDDDDHSPPSIEERTIDDLTDDDMHAWKTEHSMLDMSSIQSPTARCRGHTFQLANHRSSFQSMPPEETVMGNLLKIFPLSCTTCRAGAVASPTAKSKEVVEKSDLQKEPKLREPISTRRNQRTAERTNELIDLQQKWDASSVFEAWIITPPDNNKVPKGSMMKGYTVWCSIATADVQFPPKNFDTTYRHLNDANSRARFMFYWRNPWHLSPNKMSESVLIQSDNSAMSGCASTFHCVHPNGDKWIVSVVNDSTFKYLDDASLQRHDLDCELL
jgi:hypothetical protein